MSNDTHQELTPELQDRIALYVLGGMAAAEAGGFEAHIESCEACRREVVGLTSVVADLVLVAPEADPPPGLKERVLARAREEGFTLLPAGERTWLPADVPGVEISQLWVNHASERHTILIRLAAGASLPAHRHGGPEECYVVEGDLRDGALTLHGGDYVRYDAGTQHALSTREGCLLLVSASLHDERLAPTPA